MTDEVKTEIANIISTHISESGEGILCDEGVDEDVAFEIGVNATEDIAKFLNSNGINGMLTG